MNKIMHLLIMYHEIHRLKRQGFSMAYIGRELVLDRRSVKKILKMSEQEYLAYKQNQASRKKRLEPYEDFVQSRLEDCPAASAAQVHDWLKEHFEDLVDVHEKTVFNFVLWVRDKHGIPKPFSYRDYAQVAELPYGKQGQVDFGQFNMSTADGKRQKVYFLSIVLSRSRYKYVIFEERPFTTQTTIEAHEQSFRFFGGMPEQMVYDQDKLMLVDENKGDLILTERFRKYVEFRGFQLHFCRKGDPQSKGKIENVIKYIKYNFLRGRKYINRDTLNGQAWAWLDRTANAKVHAATQKIPQQEWIIEQPYLKPISELFSLPQVPKSYTVRKDNTIVYKSNFYCLPRGTYKGGQTKVSLKKEEEQIVIYNTEDTEIARYTPFFGKGKLIGKNNFKRDYSSKIEELINQLCEHFDDPHMAKAYLLQIRQNNPRYIRDQLLLIQKLITTHGMVVINQALDFCQENKIFKATDMQSVARKIEAQNNNATIQEQPPQPLKSLSKATFKIRPQKSDISDYNNLMT